MADVWKSQGRKFCEICKVWFGDNRASIEFHERGKKHKDALAAKLRELSRASREKEKAQAEMNTALASMEAAALNAMRENGEGIEHGPALPSTGLASKIFDPRQLKDIGSMAREMAKRKNEMQDMKNPKKVARSVPCSTPKYLKHEFRVPVENLESSVLMTVEEHKPMPSCDETVWVEADAGDGRKYYYHMYTGASQWEQPKSFYTDDEYRRRVLEKELPKSAMESETIKQEQLSTDMASLDNTQTHVISKEKVADESLVKTEPHDEETRNLVDIGDIPLPGSDSNVTGVAVKEEPLEPTNDTMVVHDSTHSITPEREPTADISHSQIDEQEDSHAQPQGPYGSWQRVGKEDNQSKLSPLTAKYRAEEQRERKLTAEREKMDAKAGFKVEFTVKTGAVLTKKVKGPIEFKKRSAAKSIRQRIQ